MQQAQTLIGYARVSTLDQNPAAQVDALEAAGCARVFTDHVSGTRGSRPQLDAALDYLRAGDVLVVWRLDRLGRSLPHLLDLVQRLDARGVEFRSLTEPGMNTTDAGGRLLFSIAGAFAAFERDIIAERTRLGLDAAAAAGRRGGRPSKLDAEQRDHIRRLAEQGVSVSALARDRGVSRATIRRALTD